MLNALLWNLLLTTGLAIVLLAVGRLPVMCRRPALRHWLWLLLLTKLVTPPLVSVPLLPAVGDDHDVAGLGALANEPVGRHESALDQGALSNHVVDDGVPSVVDEEASTGASGIPSPESQRRTPFPYLHGLLALSLLGSCVLLGAHATRVAKLCRWLRRSGIEDSVLAECCSDVAPSLGIRGIVRSRVVDVRTTPLLWGWRRPLVVMSRQFVDDLSPQQLRSIVAHELAHYVRWDHWTNMFAVLVKVLMWWNPVVWWAHREVRSAQELCCDAIVIDRMNTNRRCYAATLLQALDFIQTEPYVPRTLALEMGSRASTLRRFEMIGDTQVSYRLSRWTFLMLLILAIPLVCIPVRSQEQKPKPASTPDSSDAGVAADPVDAESENAGETRESGPVVGNRAENLYLVGITWVRNPSDAKSVPTALLLDRDADNRSRLENGAVFRVGDTSASVEEIGKDTVSLRVQGKLRTWKLGSTFAATLAEQTGPPPKKTPTKEPRRFKVEVELLEDTDALILRGDKEDVKRIGDLIGQLERRRPEAATGTGNKQADEAQPKPQLEVYELGGLDPHTVVALLQTLLAERTDVRMDADPATRKLIVLAPPPDHVTIRATLEKIRTRLTEASKPAAKGLQETEARPKDELKLRFALRFAKWDDVLEWYAEKAGLALFADSTIPGTFNYTDKKAYTVTEAMDLMNSVLLTKGYALLRRDRTLMVINVDDGIPADLVPRVTIDELDKRGKFELVSIMFSLGRRDAETVRSGIGPLLSECGTAVALPQTQQMLVTDRAGIMRTINAVIQSVPEPER